MGSRRRGQRTATALSCLLGWAGPGAGGWRSVNLQRATVRPPLKGTVISERMAGRHQARGVPYTRPLPSPFLFRLLLK